MTNQQKDLLHAWELNQQAGWAIADAIKHLKESDTPAAKGEALHAVDQARKKQVGSNSLLNPVQQKLAESLQTKTSPN